MDRQRDDPGDHQGSFTTVWRAKKFAPFMVMLQVAKVSVVGVHLNWN
jgi:hypothetical protein